MARFKITTQSYKGPGGTHLQEPKRLCVVVVAPNLEAARNSFREDGGKGTILSVVKL